MMSMTYWMLVALIIFSIVTLRKLLQGMMNSLKTLSTKRS